MPEYEDHAYIVDYMPNGYPKKRKSKPVAQAVGENCFTLLELGPKEDIDLYERVYVGKGYREKIAVVLGRLSYDELSKNAQAELPYAIIEIIKDNQDKFTRFFNESKPITNRRHELEHLPGIGKKTRNKILEERKKEPFKDLEDVKKRLSSIPDPSEVLKKRIVKEIKGGDKYNLFVGSDRLFD